MYIVGIMDTNRSASRYPRYRFPARGLAGLVLVGISWFLSWDLPGLRTHLLFFPLWLGYCLLVDALVYWRSGSSWISRNPGGYIFLFFLSAPVWWVFEGLNVVTQNWHYLGRSAFTDLQFFLLSTLSFATVIPAVFSSAELMATFPVLKDLRASMRFSLSRPALLRISLAGCAMLVLMLIWPSLFFPFMWLSLFLIIDPLNALNGKLSLLASLGKGQLGPLMTIALGALLCGFFWELWNFYSFPKWEYSIPYLDFLHIFEMPLAGYGGYIPFGWELYAVYQLTRRAAVTQH